MQVCKPSELHFGDQLKIGDDAYNAFALPQGEHMGRVMGVRANGEIVVNNMLDPLPDNKITYPWHQWAKDIPLIIVTKKLGTNQEYRADWDSAFLPDAQWKGGQTAEQAAANLMCHHCMAHNIPVSSKLPLWKLVKQDGLAFQIVATSDEDVTSPTGKKWRACFDNQWLWLVEYGETQELAVKKLKAAHPGLLTSNSVMVFHSHQFAAPPEHPDDLTDALAYAMHSVVRHSQPSRNHPRGTMRVAKSVSI